MGVALDEPRESDAKVEIDGLNFVFDASERDEMLRRGGLVLDHRSGWWGNSFVVSPSYGSCC